MCKGVGTEQTSDLQVISASSTPAGMFLVYSGHMVKLLMVSYGVILYNAHCFTVMFKHTF